jgi:hypothetical protein
MSKKRVHFETGDGKKISFIADVSTPNLGAMDRTNRQSKSYKEEVRRREKWEDER